MRLTVDPDADALYLRLNDMAIADSKPIALWCEESKAPSVFLSPAGNHSCASLSIRGSIPSQARY